MLINSIILFCTFGHLTLTQLRENRNDTKDLFQEIRRGGGGGGGRGVEDCWSHSTGPYSDSMRFIYTTQGHSTVRLGKMSVSNPLIVEILC